MIAHLIAWPGRESDAFVVLADAGAKQVSGDKRPDCPGTFMTPIPPKP